MGRERTHSRTVFSHPPRCHRACDFHRTRRPPERISSFSCSANIGEELCDHTAAMNRCPIPDDHQMARDFPQQRLQQGHDSGRVDRPFLAVKIPRTRCGDGTDGRAVVTRPPLPENGGLAYRGIGADDTGQGIEPRCIEAEAGLPLGLCPFLSAGQVSSRQRVMAVSSRWRARRAGFCRRQRMAWRRRLTWLGW